ncbi:MAG: hypothetical protein JWN72_2143 [Thermoleophilia bacterium]|nr:hypothetical protein [Thermoleophilia bacterium]
MPCMTAPHEIASNVEQVADGVWHWHITNPQIGGALSSSHAVRVERPDGTLGVVLIDPVRLDPHARQQLPAVAAIVLTARTHQRAAWHYRHQFGAEVWMPAGSTDVTDQPDHTYGAGDELPGGFVAVHTPGPEEAHYALWNAELELLVVPDLVMRAEGATAAETQVMDPAYHDDPDATRQSIARLIELHPYLLLFDHGEPVAGAAALASLTSALD